MLHRLSTILLLVTFLGLGTGGLARLHDLQHEADDAREAVERRAAGLPPEQHHHDESNCRVHAQLHMPMVGGSWCPPLLKIGLLVGVAPILPQSTVHRRPPPRADCRDPPAPPLL